MWHFSFCTWYYLHKACCTSLSHLLHAVGKNLILMTVCINTHTHWHVHMHVLMHALMHTHTHMHVHTLSCSPSSSSSSSFSSTSLLWCVCVQRVLSLRGFHCKTRCGLSDPGPDGGREHHEAGSEASAWHAQRPLRWGYEPGEEETAAGDCE